MTPFVTLTGVAAPLPLANIDTDKIIPAAFMKTIRRTGLGRHLFDALRYEDGREKPGFVLNREPYRRASILIAGDNFGCGSSREHAPWALLDFGIRCIVAPGFADIFYGNCFKNGILPVILPAATCDTLMADAQGADPVMTIDLERRTIVRADGGMIGFEVDPVRRHKLLNGLDDIALTLHRTAAIDAFERRAAAAAVPSRSLLELVSRPAS